MILQNNCRERKSLLKKLRTVMARSFFILIIFKYEMLLINPMKYCILKEYM